MPNQTSETISFAHIYIPDIELHMPHSHTHTHTQTHMGIAFVFVFVLCTGASIFICAFTFHQLRLLLSLLLPFPSSSSASASTSAFGSTKILFYLSGLFLCVNAKCEPFFLSLFEFCSLFAADNSSRQGSGWAGQGRGTVG